MRLRSRPHLEPVEGDARSAEAVRRKGILICPGCGHESHVEGDWIRHESTDRIGYACPDCGCLVVSQPSFDGPDGR